MKFEALSLDEAYIKAAKELSCSVTELKVSIIQNPSKGFLGMFAKNAIIEVEVTKDDLSISKSKKVNKQETDDSNIDLSKTDKKRKNHKKKSFSKLSNDSSIIDKSQSDNTISNDKKINKINEQILLEIELGLKKLFGASCFKIDKISVSKFSDNCVYIKLDGEDAALLIGKEGYRYKAISYLIFNWINLKYNVSMRLEIAQFLQNQEETMNNYLKSIIDRVNNNGYAQTKILDGVLIKIALEQLRQKFPDKYVGIKSLNDGKCIVVNEFLKK